MKKRKESINFEHITIDPSDDVEAAKNQIEDHKDPFLECKRRIIKVELHRLKEEHLIEEKPLPTIQQDPFLECRKRMLKVTLVRLKDENEDVLENKAELTVKQYEPCFDDSTTQLENSHVISESSSSQVKSEINSQVKWESFQTDEDTGLEILGPKEPCFDNSTAQLMSPKLEYHKITGLKSLLSEVESEGVNCAVDSQSDDDISNWSDSASTDGTLLPSNVPLSVVNEGETENSLNSYTKTPLSKNKNHYRGKCNKQYKSTKLFKEHALSKCGIVWPFICKKCGQGFRSQYYFLIHKIRKCRQRLSGNRSAVAHENLISGSLGSYVCKVCDKRFSKAYLFANHRSISHRISKPHGFKQKSGCLEKSEKHVKSAHRKRSKLPCSYCSRQFNQKRQLTSHLATEICGANCCKCCRKRFSSDVALELHIDSKVCGGSNNYFICSVCNKGYVNKDQFKVHTNKKCTGSKVYHCVKCVLNFCSRSNLKAHLARHSIIVEPAICSKCSKTISTHARLKRHEEACGKERGFKCNECNAKFTNRTSLIYHIKSKCDSLSLFDCDKCHKVFRNKHYLIAHLKTKCNSLKPFVCKVCGYGFSFKQSLSQHEYSKCGTLKKFLCNLCGKTFPKQSELKVHLDSKCGSFMPYQCDKCPKGFFRKSSLTTHTNTNCGKKKLYKCNDCQKELCNITVLKVHIASKCLIYPNTNRTA